MKDVQTYIASRANGVIEFGLTVKADADTEDSLYDIPLGAARDAETVDRMFDEAMRRIASAAQQSGMTHAHPEGTDQTSRDVYWIAHAKALALQTGSRGSFAAIIGDAFIRADSRNAARLIGAFPELLAD